MLEEDVDILVFLDEAGDLLPDGGAVRWGVFGLAEAAVDESAGDDIGGGEVIAFGEAESGRMLFEEAVDGVAHPGGMAEFEGAAETGRYGIEEGFKERLVAFQVGGKLEEEGTETPDDAQGVDGLKENFVERGGSEALDMGNALVGLEDKEEGFGRGLDPVFECGGGGEAAEGVVDFHGVEAGGVVGEEFIGGEAGGVEVRLPGRVGEAGCAGIELGHSFSVAGRWRSGGLGRQWRGSTGGGRSDGDVGHGRGSGFDRRRMWRAR